MQDRRAGIDLPQPRRDLRIIIPAGRKISLGQDNPVGHRHLFDRFHVIKRRRAIDRVDGGEDAVKPEACNSAGWPMIDCKHRGRIGEAGGFDDNPVQRRIPPVCSRSIRSDSVSTSAPRTVQHRHPSESSIMPSSACSTSK